MISVRQNRPPRLSWTGSVTAPSSRKFAMDTFRQADPIYLDYNASTPIDPRVADAMIPYLREHFGNPSSSHAFGQRTKAAVDTAREQAAAFLGVEPDGIIFTSGGTEANNHALIGAALAARDRGDHIVTTAVEHPAVSEVCRYLETRGFSTTYVPVDENCQVDADEVIAAFTERTVLVSVMHANNEVGALQPVAEIAAAARTRGIISHTDCAQSAGKVPVRLDDLGVDMLSAAGHKLYGPKGVGMLCLRAGITLPNLMFGAGHESGRRPGTENILEIVGVGTACEIAAAELDHEINRLAMLRDQLQSGLLSAFPEARVNGHQVDRLPNTLSISFPGLVAADIIGQMPEIAVSAGAACHGDGGVTISHVLRAMGVPDRYALGTLRISTGRMTTDKEITAGLAAITRAVQAAGQQQGD